MGNYRVEVDAVGGHGCQRDVGDGETVEESCGNEHCPDCITREFVAKLKAKGSTVNSATLTHWPGQESEVKDDLLTLERTGSF